MSRRAVSDAPPPGWTRVFDKKENEVYFVPPGTKTQLATITDVEKYWKKTIGSGVLLNPLQFEFGLHSKDYDGKPTKGAPVVAPKPALKKPPAAARATKAAVKETVDKAAAKKAATKPAPKKAATKSAAKSAPPPTTRKNVAAAAVKEPPKPKKAPSKGQKRTGSQDSNRSVSTSRSGGKTVNLESFVPKRSSRSSHAQPIFGPSDLPVTTHRSRAASQTAQPKKVTAKSKSPPRPAAKTEKATKLKPAPEPKSGRGKSTPVVEKTEPPTKKQKQAPAQPLKKANEPKPKGKEVENAPAPPTRRGRPLTKAESDGRHGGGGAQPSKSPIPESAPAPLTRVTKKTASATRKPISKARPPPKKESQKKTSQKGKKEAAESKVTVDPNIVDITLEDLLPVRETRQGFRSVTVVPKESKTKTAKKPMQMKKTTVAIEKPKSPEKKAEKKPDPPKSPAKRKRTTSIDSPPKRSRHLKVPPNVAEITAKIRKFAGTETTKSPETGPALDGDVSSGDEIVLDNKLRKPASRPMRVVSKVGAKTVQKKKRSKSSPPPGHIDPVQLISQISAVLATSRNRNRSGASDSLEDLIKSQVAERSFTLSGRAIKPTASQAYEPTAWPVRPVDTPEPPKKEPKAGVLPSRRSSRRSDVKPGPKPRTPKTAKATPKTASKATPKTAPKATPKTVPKSIKKIETSATSSPLRQTRRASKRYSPAPEAKPEPPAKKARGRKREASGRVKAMKAKAKSLVARAQKVKSQAKRGRQKKTVAKMGRPKKEKVAKATPKTKGRPSVRAKALESPKAKQKPLTPDQALALVRSLSAKRRVKTIPPQVKGGAKSPLILSQVSNLPRVTLPASPTEKPVHPSKFDMDQVPIPSPSSSSTDSATAMLMNGHGDLIGSGEPLPPHLENLSVYPSRSPQRERSGSRHRTETENLETICLDWNTQDMEVYNTLSALTGTSHQILDSPQPKRRSSGHRKAAAFVSSFAEEPCVELPPAIANDHCYIKRPQPLEHRVGSGASIGIDFQQGTPVSDRDTSGHELLVSPYPQNPVVVPSTLGSLVTAVDLLTSADVSGSTPQLVAVPPGGMPPPSTSPFLFADGSNTVSTTFPSIVSGFSEMTSATPPQMNTSSASSVYATPAAADPGAIAAATSGSPPNFLDILNSTPSGGFPTYVIPTQAQLEEILASAQAQASEGEGETSQDEGPAPALISQPGIPATTAPGQYVQTEYFDASVARNRQDLVPDFLPDNILEGDSTDMSADNE